MSTSDLPPASSSPLAPAPKSAESIQLAQSAIRSCSQIMGHIPDSLSSSDDPALALFNYPAVASAVSDHLHQPISGAGDDNLCGWLYDTFQSTDPSLQLTVLRFLPLVGGLYLLHCTAGRHHQPLAGFEAVLQALYSHETMSRDGKPVAIDLPNLSAPSPYHEAKAASLKSSKSTEEPAVATPVVNFSVLEPHGTVRSTKRARIVGVALELYHASISSMPLDSKIEFCQLRLGLGQPLRLPPAECGKESDEEGEEVIGIHSNSEDHKEEESGGKG